MAESYVLDTSAIFTLTRDERGRDTVEDILISAQKGKCRVYLSFISLMEIYYITWQEKSESSAKELVILVKSLPVEIMESSERIALSAGRIKANHKLSVADALIAATAMDKGAVLVHKDPELEAVSDYIETRQLPYKRRKGGVPKKNL